MHVFAGMKPMHSLAGSRAQVRASPVWGRTDTGKVKLMVTGCEKEQQISRNKNMAPGDQGNELLEVR